MPDFSINAAYRPVADQREARDRLAAGILDGDRFQTLLGVTGSGKTATMAFAIEQVQRPTLVIAHNKTLAAQLCNEFREFFPKNSVEYFVSYYDYYQPEAYVPAQDLYIEKDSSINEEIDRLRHSATSALFARRDVIVVASVSCIYGLGSPSKYNAQVTLLKRGEMVDRDEVLRKLVDNMYTRNDQALGRGTFRVRGETLEVFPAYAETAYRAVFFGDEIEAIQHFDPLTGEVFNELEHAGIWPATHYATDRPTIERAVGEIRDEIENYSRILDGRRPGERPFCLLDFFPDDFVCFIDESHQTVPQIGGMYEGDRSRKQTLVDYGFRLPREGLDLPEVSLVAIIDADKEGFLRGETSLIQTIGRAARTVRGRVIMYADKESSAMRKAIEETDRRREIQLAYNQRHGITPETVRKGISDITDFLALESKVPRGTRRSRSRDREAMPPDEIPRTIVELEEEMLLAADDLRFEYAAKLRDEIKALRQELDEAEARA